MSLTRCMASSIFDFAAAIRDCVVSAGCAESVATDKPMSRNGRSQTTHSTSHPNPLPTTRRRFKIRRVLKNWWLGLATQERLYQTVKCGSSVELEMELPEMGILMCVTDCRLKGLAM